jgi:phosphate/sulfate permease
MILPVAFVLGMILGWQRATRRGGDRLDKWQYAVAHGIAFTLAALVLTILARHLGLI